MRPGPSVALLAPLPHPWARTNKNCSGEPVTEPKMAVFLSYASEDAAVAERICNALRAGGIEVWLDQSELRGGDAWDQKIRQQIRECALFIPIVSANTASRREGYFRLEWDLADQRTHKIARNRAFLVPVALDSAPNAAADVPESFLRVQWTRLPAGNTPDAFVERVSHLLALDESPVRGQIAPLAEARLETAAKAKEAPRTAGTSRRLSRFTLLLVAAAIAIAAALLVVDKFWLSNHPAEKLTAPPTVPAHDPHDAVPEKSIAVLPFVDMSEKQDQEYFSEGLAEELLDLLAQVPDLRVPARTSSFYFKGKTDDIAVIAQKLRVAHVLEGSVRKAGNTIRVTAQLIRADNGYHLWSKSYDRDLKDIFKVQDEIANAVVEALKLKLLPAQDAANSHRTANPEAYGEYLIGRQSHSRRTEEGYRRAIGAYHRAIALDPGYGAAYAGLAMSEVLLAESTHDTARFDQAIMDAEKSVTLAPNLADSYATRGFLRYYRLWDWSGAQEDFAKALALDPGDSSVHVRYSGLLSALGKLPEATSASKEATDLDPLSTVAWQRLARYYLAAGQFTAARDAIRRALEISPESVGAQNIGGSLQLAEGKAAEALITYQQNTDEPMRLAGCAMAEHALGHANESQHNLDELIAKHSLDSAYFIAEVHAWRGNKSEAFDWLDRAFDRHDNNFFNLKLDPKLASLRGDPRYRALLRKLNLPAT
jgi:TolB-like protein/Tfp pilus assembly protein PilF